MTSCYPICLESEMSQQTGCRNEVRIRRTLQIKFSLVFSIDYVKLKEIKKEKQVRISSSVDLVFSFSLKCKRYKEDTNDETESKRAGKAHAAHGR